MTFLLLYSICKISTQDAHVKFIWMPAVGLRLAAHGCLSAYSCVLYEKFFQCSYARKHAHIQLACTHKQMYARTHAHACTHAQMHAYIHTHTHVHTHTCAMEFYICIIP